MPDKTPQDCTTCNGEGYYQPHVARIICPDCNGTGKTHPLDKHQRELEKILFPDHCSSCHAEWDEGYGWGEEPCCTKAASNIRDAVESIIARTNRESRIDEVMRWMPISPDPHNSWDMRFVEAGKRRIAELESQQQASNE